MADDAAANAIGAWLHGAAVGAAHAAGNFNNWVQAQPTLQQGVGDLVKGIVNGSSDPAPAKGKAAAPAAAAATAAPKYTQAQLDAAPNFVQQWNAANPTKAVTAGPAASSAPAAQPTPLDVIRSAAMNNGGLSLSQLASLSDSVARTVPQATKPVPQTSKEAGLAQYMTLANDYAIRSAQDPNYAKSQAGAAHKQLMEDIRSGVAAANPINDVATGMPQLQN